MTASSSYLSCGGVQPLFASLLTQAYFEYLIYGSALLVVAVGLFLWAGTVRKPRKRKERHHWRSGSPKHSIDLGAATKQRRRRRRSEPPRNPTLAETRGLPPLREGPEDPKQHYQH